MKLSCFLKESNISQREFAASLDITQVYVSKMCLEHFEPSPKIAFQIEKATGGKVTRRDLRKDWQSIWPELDHDSDEFKKISGFFDIKNNNDFIFRLKLEQEQLSERLKSLSDFLSSEKSESVEKSLQLLLENQKTVMEDYLKILNERLEKHLP